MSAEPREERPVVCVPAVPAEPGAEAVPTGAVRTRDLDPAASLWAPTLTLEVLNAAIRDMANEADSRRAEERERITNFWRTVPERLHDHPFVGVMAHSLLGPAIFHPADARAIDEEFQRLVGLGADELAADKARFLAELR